MQWWCCLYPTILSFFSSSDLHIDEWKVLFALDALVFLGFSLCHLDNSSLAHLVELIPLMTNLQKLDITTHNINEGNSYWIKVLHQLSMTNVCNLSFGMFHDDLAPNLYDDYCSAWRRLIQPVLENLRCWRYLQGHVMTECCQMNHH